MHGIISIRHHSVACGSGAGESKGAGAGGSECEYPLFLENKFHKRAAVFTPQNLLREATRQPVLCPAHVMNCMAKSEGDFEKGQADGSVAI